MRQFLRKHKRPLIIVLAVVILFFGLIALDVTRWRLNVSANKKILEGDAAVILTSNNADSLGTKEQYWVSAPKWTRTVDGSISQEIIIDPAGDMAGELTMLFEQLKRRGWDTNFEEFKTELIVGESRFPNQGIKFYPDGYDPNTDYNFIQVYRVDNGITLGDVRVQSPAYQSESTGLIVVRLDRAQKPSVIQSIIGQFTDL